MKRMYAFLFAFLFFLLGQSNIIAQVLDCSNLRLEICEPIDDNTDDECFRVRIPVYFSVLGPIQDTDFDAYYLLIEGEIIGDGVFDFQASLNTFANGMIGYQNTYAISGFYPIDNFLRIANRKSK